MRCTENSIGIMMYHNTCYNRFSCGKYDFIDAGLISEFKVFHNHQSHKVEEDLGGGGSITCVERAAQAVGPAPVVMPQRGQCT